MKFKRNPLLLIIPIFIIIWSGVVVTCGVLEYNILNDGSLFPSLSPEESKKRGVFISNFKVLGNKKGTLPIVKNAWLEHRYIKPTGFYWDTQILGIETSLNIVFLHPMIKKPGIIIQVRSLDDEDGNSTSKDYVINNNEQSISIISLKGQTFDSQKFGIYEINWKKNHELTLVDTLILQMIKE